MRLRVMLGYPIDDVKKCPAQQMSDDQSSSVFKPKVNTGKRETN